MSYCLSILLLMGSRMLQYRTEQENKHCSTTMDLFMKVFWWIYACILLPIFLGVELLCHKICICLTFIDTTKLLWLRLFTVMYESSTCSLSNSWYFLSYFVLIISLAVSWHHCTAFPWWLMKSSSLSIYFFALLCSLQDLSSLTLTPAVETWSLNHWNTRKVLLLLTFKLAFYY